MVEILQRSIPYDVFPERPLPGVQPLAPDDWLLVDDAYAPQMARRARLLDRQRNDVVFLGTGAQDAAAELLDTVLDTLKQCFQGVFEVRKDAVERPDGIMVPLGRSDPMGTLGHLVQEDLCILQKRGDEHVLTGAVLCFPASWRLSEKAGRPLIEIHNPVDSYDAGMARRVQRLFDGVRAGKPMWRFNALWYDDPELHQPTSRGLSPRGPATSLYLRSERQCIFRLPESRAVVFSIHSFVVKAPYHQAKTCAGTSPTGQVPT